MYEASGSLTIAQLSSVSSLSASEPLKARIAFLVALWLLRYAHLPEVKEWKEKVAILDMAVQTHLDRLVRRPEPFLDLSFLFLTL